MTGNGVSIDFTNVPKTEYNSIGFKQILIDSLEQYVAGKTLVQLSKILGLSEENLHSLILEHKITPVQEIDWKTEKSRLYTVKSIKDILS